MERRVPGMPIAGRQCLKRLSRMRAVGVAFVLMYLFLHRFFVFGSIRFVRNFVSFPRSPGMLFGGGRRALPTFHAWTSGGILPALGSVFAFRPLFGIGPSHFADWAVKMAFRRRSTSRHALSSCVLDQVSFRRLHC